jgi:hypothetical protein
MNITKLLMLCQEVLYCSWTSRKCRRSIFLEEFLTYQPASSLSWSHSLLQFCNVHEVPENQKVASEDCKVAMSGWSTDVWSRAFFTCAQFRSLS